MVSRPYYTIKLLSSRLKRYNYNISLTLNEGKETGEIIYLSDNQILRTIRDIRKQNVSQDVIEELFQERIKLRKNIKTKKDIQELKKLQNKINHIMYIPDYVTVVIENNKHYEYIYKNGIVINGNTYKRLSCSAGQARNSTVVLCNTDIIDEVKERLNNGRNLKKKFSPSKFNAYFGLASSSTRLVTEPRFIVVKDYINTDTYTTNFVTETGWDEDDIVEEREITQEMNRTDGMGLISPQMAEIWAHDLDLDYVPCQFCVRQAFIKGMLCVFDFLEFCKEKNNGNYIVDTIYTDENGETIKADLRDYDIIISESQFKLWDSYDSVDEYIQKTHDNKLYWGVTQMTPRTPKEILKLNYQFIQTLHLSEEEIHELCSQFVEWVTGVTSDNIAYTLLFLLGVHHDETIIRQYLQNNDRHWVKSLIVNHELIKDRYIRDRIYQSIKKRLENGCLGDIYVYGNFQVLISDPYGFMQHVCGLPVTGLLKKGEFYSNFWNERGVTVVDSMRSPLTYRSEHVILHLRNDEETNKWYKYCKLGIILNYHGHECVNYAGADFDFDILATTSNQQVINGVYTDELTITYDPPKPAKILFTEDDLYKADVFSFGSIIGNITNKSSSAYALLPLIEKRYGKDSDEYIMLNKRIQQCCKAQSAQID